MHISNESLLVILVVGLVAGWLAGKIVRGAGFGLIGDIVIGIVGAFIGDWLLPQIGIYLGTTETFALPHGREPAGDACDKFDGDTTRNSWTRKR